MFVMASWVAFWVADNTFPNPDRKEFQFMFMLTLLIGLLGLVLALEAFSFFGGIAAMVARLPNSSDSVSSSAAPSFALALALVCCCVSLLLPPLVPLLKLDCCEVSLSF